MSKTAQHTKSDESDHRKAKRIILNVLRNYGRGKDNAISSQRLAKPTPVSQSTVRDLVHELRREVGVPVDSAPGGGYFLIESQDEFADCIERRQETIKTKRERIRELEQAWGER